VRLGNTIAKFAVVPVPEAAMNKNDFLPCGKRQVGLARQFRFVEPISISHTMNQMTNLHLWLCVLRTHQCHLPASLFRGEIVHRRQNYHTPTKMKVQYHQN
jgi:hypothetical protein